MEDMAMPTARATHEQSRKRLCLTVGIAIALVGCTQEDYKDPYMRNDPFKNERGVLRMRLADRCMQSLPAGPVRTQYNDWDEVVRQCDNNAYYQASTCRDPSPCLAALDAQGTEARRAATTGAVHDGPVRKDAPND